MWRKEIKRHPLCVSPDYQDLLNIILIQVDESEATKLRELNASLPTPAGRLWRERRALFCVRSRENHEAAESAEAAAETGGFRPPCRSENRYPQL